MALSPNTNHKDVADDEPADELKTNHTDVAGDEPARDAPPRVVIDHDTALYMVCNGRVCRVFKTERRAAERERRGGGGGAAGGVKHADRVAAAVPSFSHRVAAVSVPTTAVPAAMLTRRSLTRRTMPHPPVLAADMTTIATRVRTRRRVQHHQGRAAGETIDLLSSDED